MSRRRKGPRIATDIHRHGGERSVRRSVRNWHRHPHCRSSGIARSGSGHMDGDDHRLWRHPARPHTADDQRGDCEGDSCATKREIRARAIPRDRVGCRGRVCSDDVSSAIGQPVSAGAHARRLRSEGRCAEHCNGTLHGDGQALADPGQPTSSTIAPSVRRQSVGASAAGCRTEVSEIEHR